MVDYAIGDVQGCYEPLQRLLDHVDFNDRVDRLWFVGDLVNRGPDSLAVLRFVKNLPVPANITLGNHDLHLLSLLFTQVGRHNSDDTLGPILMAHDREELGHWLRGQALLHEDVALNIVMTHAGIAPGWDLVRSRLLAKELHSVLSGDAYVSFLSQMYGNSPSYWHEDLVGIERLRVICNYFTRMRFCDLNGHLNLEYKGDLAHAPASIYPWYEVPKRYSITADIIFGHWAALNGKTGHAHLHAIDTGCVWGGKLTALRLQDKKRFTVPGV